MPMHSSVFGHLKPTDNQLQVMANVRAEFRLFVESLDYSIPDGPDKTYLMRQLRDCAMWANVAITRLTDGFPRKQ